MTVSPLSKRVVVGGRTVDSFEVSAFSVSEAKENVSFLLDAQPENHRQPFRLRQGLVPFSTSAIQCRVKDERIGQRAACFVVIFAFWGKRGGGGTERLVVMSIWNPPDVGLFFYP